MCSDVDPDGFAFIWVRGFGDTGWPISNRKWSRSLRNTDKVWGARYKMKGEADFWDFFSVWNYIFQKGANL